MFEHIYEGLSPLSSVLVLPDHHKIVICRIHFYLLNRTDQFTLHSLSGLIPSQSFNSPLSSLPFLLTSVLPLPSLTFPQHVLHLWFCSGSDQRLSYVQGLQA